MINRRTFLKFVAATPAVVFLPKIVQAKINEPDKLVDKLLYLEVSPRRSGKTTRLVTHMINHIETTGEDVYFISGSNLMWNQTVSNYIPSKYWDKILRLPPPEKRKDNIRCYYDEAAYVPPEQQAFRRNAYYVGTPRGTDNFLYKLVEFNNGNYKKYPHNIDIEILNNMRENLNTQKFNEEVYGNFM
jgi:hypothetical protein